MSERIRYWSPIFDSARWEGFAFRPGDIVISTPPKSGTTWTQMLCAMLIFDGPKLPATLDRLSPWLDVSTHSKSEVHALLGAQTHRRFIKTHTPLDGLPWDERVTYLVVGRDPRDVSISLEYHMANMDFDVFLAAREAAVGNADLEERGRPAPPSEDPAERFRDFVEHEASPTDYRPALANVLHHLHTGWQMRGAPNVSLFHFADYKADLPGEIERLARVLGLPLEPGRARELAAEAGLERMRARAHELAPGVTQDHWKDRRAFFRTGGSGEWRDRVGEQDIARYDERVAELTGDPTFATWVHQGRLRSGIDLDAGS